MNRKTTDFRILCWISGLFVLFFYIHNCTENPFYPDLPPAAEGFYEAGYVLKEDVVDASRDNRSVPLAIFYPAKSNGINAKPDKSNAPYPLIMLSHGFMSNKLWYTFLSNHLARHGYVVVAMDHTTSDTSFILNFLNQILVDNGVSSILQLPSIMDDIETIMNDALTNSTIADMWFQRPIDVSFAIDQAILMNKSDAKLKGMIDSSKIGMTGHSMGGYTTLAVSGARLNVGNIEETCSGDPAGELFCNVVNSSYFNPSESFVDFRDERITASIPMAPVVDLTFIPGGLDYLSIPVMIAGATEDTSTPYDEHQLQPFNLMTNERYLLTVIGGNHLTFNDKVEDCIENFDLTKINDPLKSMIEPFLELDLSELIDQFGSIMEGMEGMDDFIFDANIFSADVDFDTGHQYMSAMAVAFFGKYIKGNSALYDSYLTQSYATELSNKTGVLTLDSAP